MLYLLLLGPPGSGKGTQAQLLEKQSWIRISTGDLLRENIKNQTEIGRKVVEIMGQGKLVDNEIAFELVKNKIESLGTEKIILDGFPRNIEQAMLLEDYRKTRRSNFVIIMIELSDSEITKRNTGRRTCLQCQRIYNIHYSPPQEKDKCDDCGSVLVLRDDDKEEIIQERIKVYRKEINEITDFFEKWNQIVMIDGVLPAMEIHSKITSIIEEISDRDQNTTRNIEN